MAKPKELRSIRRTRFYRWAMFIYACYAVSVPFSAYYPRTPAFGIASTGFFGFSLIILFADFIYSRQMFREYQKVERDNEKRMEIMRPIWLPGYLAARAEGLRLEREYKEKHRTETRTEAVAYTLQMTNQF